RFQSGSGVEIQLVIGAQIGIDRKTRGTKTPFIDKTFIGRLQMSQAKPNIAGGYIGQVALSAVASVTAIIGAEPVRIDIESIAGINPKPGILGGDSPIGRDTSD